MTAPAATEVKTPRQILELTRAIFASTHWTVGAYTAITQVQDTDESGWRDKPMACAVGGLRYMARAPLDHALDESWMLTNFRLGDQGWDMAGEGLEAAQAYLAALEALYAVAYPSGFRRYQKEKADAADLGADEADRLFNDITMIEDLIVDWNDGHDFSGEEERQAIVAAEILPVFDEAIASLSA